MWKQLCKVTALGLCILTVLNSCKTVKGYQKQYLNDNAMQQGAFPIEKSENEGTTYREGAAGGDMSKSGGGCGCN